MFQLGERLDSKIRISDDFETFVCGSIEALKKEDGVDVRPFLETVFREDNIETVLFTSHSNTGGTHTSDFEARLRKLFQRVHKQVIDIEYANLLASGLAYKVLSPEFGKQKCWSVDPTKLPKNHPFRSHVIQNTWPTKSEIEDSGDHWHELPLVKCYEVPGFLDPSLLYTDNSHSITRSELVTHVRTYPGTPIPSGLKEDYLIIGLKPKERELELEGRFFALMLWRLGVLCDNGVLIKRFYLPLSKFNHGR